MKTTFSPDRKYRYTLWRAWGIDVRYVNFIGLNPSTADETADDPTIRKCMEFAKRWGYGAMCMTNLFALRATDPRILKKSVIPISPPDNPYWIMEAAKNADLVVAAWGNHGAYLKQGLTVTNLFLAGKHLKCFGTNKDGSPKHPLYLPYTTPLQDYDPI
jgi:hypothetical protein